MTRQNPKRGARKPSKIYITRHAFVAVESNSKEHNGDWFFINDATYFNLSNAIHIKKWLTKYIKWSKSQRSKK